MKIVDIYSLINHKAMAASAERAIHRGNKVIAIGRRENASSDMRALSGVIFIDSLDKCYFKRLMYECKDYDYIFLHSLAENYTFAFHMITHRSMLKRLVWLIAGGDLYSWAQPVKGNKCIGAVVRNIIAKYYRLNIPFVICSAIDSYKYTKDFGRGVVYTEEANNPGFSFEELELNKPDVLSNTPLRIMVGHCSSRELHHIEVIQTLLKCRFPEDTQFVFPLSYGNSEYGDKVAKEAKKVFGKNAIIIREHLPFSDYTKLLWSIDCAIFNTERQIAIGNLLMLLYMKKKIVLCKNSPIMNYFSDKGVKALSVDEISVESIVCSDNYNFDRGRELAIYINDNKLLDKERSDIYADLESRLKLRSKR